MCTIVTVGHCLYLEKRRHHHSQIGPLAAEKYRIDLVRTAIACTETVAANSLPLDWDTSLGRPIYEVC